MTGKPAYKSRKVFLYGMMCMPDLKSENEELLFHLNINSSQGNSQGNAESSCFVSKQNS